MVRAFIALELSGAVKDQLKDAQEALRGSSARLTFVVPEIIHITVKFLGEVSEKDLLRVQELLKEIPFSPFPVTAGIVTVNNPKRPHTVWCRINDEGKGEMLCRFIEDRLEPLGFGRETRRFTPHATIARVKVHDPSLFFALQLLRVREYGRCMITGMKLKKSTLTPAGPLYEDLAEVVW